MLGKTGKDQLDWSCEKISIIEGQERKEYLAYNKMKKKGQLDFS